MLETAVQTMMAYQNMFFSFTSTQSLVMRWVETECERKEIKSCISLWPVRAFSFYIQQTFQYRNIKYIETYYLSV